MEGDMFDAVPISGGGLGASASGPRMGIDGGEIRNGVGGTAGKDWFQDGMDIGGGALPEFLNEAFAPALQAAKEERMWDGFVKAREGATMQEITEDQPWYTRMFGPTDYELGASMYTVQKNVSDMEADVVARMPELRKLDSAAMGKELNRLSQSAQTGNAFTDTLLRKQLMDRAGPVMDLHTKERVAWQQGELVRHQTEAIGSASTAYNSMMVANAKLGKNAPLDQSVVANQTQARAALFDTLRTSQYQTDGSIKEVYTAGIRGMADRGEFYAVNALIDAGVLSALEPDDAEKLTKYVDSQQMRFRQRWQATPENVEAIARIHAEVAAGIGGKPTMDHAVALSNEYMVETGSRVPLWDADEIGRFAGSSMSNYISQRQRAEDKRDARLLRESEKQDKDEAESRNAAEAADRFLEGSFGDAVDYKHVDRKDLERGAKGVFDQLMAKGDVKTAMGLLVFNHSTKNGKRVDMISASMQHDLESTLDENVSDAFMAQYFQWKALRDSAGFKRVGDRMERVDTTAGPTVALDYYGAALTKRLEQFDRTFKGDPSKADLAYRLSFGQAAHDSPGDIRGLDSQETKANIASIREQVDAMDGGTVDRWFGDGQRLHPSTAAVVSAAAEHYWESLPAEWASRDRARAAVSLAQKNGLEVAGRFGWTNQRGQSSIAGYLNDNGEKSGAVMDWLIDKKLSESGGDGATSITILRMPDKNGEPFLHVIAWTDEGMVDATVTGPEMKNAYRNDAVRQSQRAGLPQGYIVNDEGRQVPSIQIQPKL